MAFDSFVDFLAMGGHGPYVWLAYASGALVIAWNIFLPRWQARKLRQQITRQIRLEEHINADEPRA